MLERDLLIHRLGVGLLVAATAASVTIWAVVEQSFWLSCSAAPLGYSAVLVFRLTLESGRFAADEEVRQACRSLRQALCWFTGL